MLLWALNNMKPLGIQRVMVNILNNWSQKDLECALSLHDNKGELMLQLKSDCKIYYLDKIIPPIKFVRTLSRLLAYFVLIKRSKPKVVIALNQFESLCLCIVKRLLDFKLIVCEHCHVSSNIDGADRHAGWFGLYYKKRFVQEYRKYADCIVTVAEDAKQDLIENFHIESNKIKVIYNPVDIDSILSKSNELFSHKYIDEGRVVFVASSRITAQKRIDLMIKGFARIIQSKVKEHIGLIICGDGPLLMEMQKLRDELELQGHVEFIGFQENPWRVIKKANFFISTSEWEGLPCSLIEAQALGVPVISSDCLSGPREILLDGRAGFLFKSLCLDDFLEQINLALSDSQEVATRVLTANSNLARFALKNILHEYHSIAVEVCKS